MNWSLLLPSTWNIFSAFQHLFDPSSQIASQALSDVFILVTIGIAVVAAVRALLETRVSLALTRVYLQAMQGAQDAARMIASSELPLFRELNHHLLEFPNRDGSGRTSWRRTVDAADVFRDSRLAPGFTTSRFFLAVPGILTGLGVLGTFVGLQMGIGGLDLTDLKTLDKSILPLIQGCAVAFSTSVWGVTASLAFSGFEKSLEGWAFGRIRELQNRIDALVPRFVPEEALAELERTSRGTEDLLKGLAVAIGDQMQKAIGRLGSEIKEAVANATSEGHGPLMEQSAKLLSDALTAELVELKKQVSGMAETFSQQFTGASNDLMRSVQGFEPTVKLLSGTVDNAQRTVVDAVGKLNAHEAVMQEMGTAAADILQAAEAFATMRDTLQLSSTRNEEAARAQLSAAEANQRVAEKFDHIGDRLPEMRQTLEDAARVIGSLGAPIVELKTLLASQPELQREFETSRLSLESERNNRLLEMSNGLAEKVGQAATQLTNLGDLAENLTSAATSMKHAGNELSAFGQQILQASKDQRDASEAARAAALSGERTAKALEPLPGAITGLTSGLQTAGASVKMGAEAARDSYKELVTLQRQWFAGVELGLNAMKDRLQSILKAYGDQVEGQTRGLMKQWTEEVATCLQTYETQVAELQGGLDELQAALSRFSKK